MTSQDIILPNAIAHPYCVPAKRLGYILRVTKEHYKDNGLERRNYLPKTLILAVPPN